jgi:hypothetical protein
VTQILARVPGDVDADARRTLEDGFTRLFELTSEQCDEQKGQETDTETTPAPPPPPPPPETETETVPTVPEEEPEEEGDSGKGKGKGKDKGNGGTDEQGGVEVPGTGGGGVVAPGEG